MKKIYFAPNTTVVNVQLQQMIATSPLSLDEEGGSGELQNVNGDPGIVLSRGGSLWDDDEY